jgi:hypothetical protein
MRASAANRQYLGQNTLRDLDAEYTAGGAANQSHAPQAARARREEWSPEARALKPRMFDRLQNQPGDRAMPVTSVVSGMA